MIKFKTADPSRRTPVYLQAYTKENLIWQLKTSVILVVSMMAYDWYMDRKQMKELKN